MGFYLIQNLNYITHPHVLLHNNPDILTLQSIKNINIPPSPIAHAQWIEDLANIAKNVKIEATKSHQNTPQLIVKYPLPSIEHH